MAEWFAVPNDPTQLLNKLSDDAIDMAGDHDMMRSILEIDPNVLNKFVLDRIVANKEEIDEIINTGSVEYAIAAFMLYGFITGFGWKTLNDHRSADGLSRS